MACQPRRILEAVSRRQARVRRTEPDSTAEAGSAPTLGRSCKQQLGSGPKSFRCRGLVVRPCRRGSCKQQLGFGSSLYPARLPAQTTPPRGILQTTSLWFTGRPSLILQAWPMTWNNSNSSSTPRLRKFPVVKDLGLQKKCSDTPSLRRRVAGDKVSMTATRAARRHRRPEKLCWPPRQPGREKRSRCR